MSSSNGEPAAKREAQPTILVTGACGFVGFHLCRRLFDLGWRVVGWDTESVNYPTTTIRHKRKELLLKEAPPSFVYKDVNIERLAEVEGGWDSWISVVVHLAARAGVRESLADPAPYIAANLVGHFHVMDKARREKVAHFLYASSSSVYGKDATVPFTESDPCNTPVSLYAATKKADELMAYSYAHLYKLPCTGLRFFTVYGPWGRPDMAVYDFTTRISQGRPITVFNHGANRRAFTFVEDVVSGIVACVSHPPRGTAVGDGQSGPGDQPPYKVYNIGSGDMVTTNRLVELLEEYLGAKAKASTLALYLAFYKAAVEVEMTGPLACDMVETGADLSALEADVHYRPKVPIEQGLKAFVDWYQDFYAQPDHQSLR